MTTDVDAYVIEPERKSRHYKWWFVALGALIVLMGVACLAWPAPALMAVAIAVGACFLGSGITTIGAFFDLRAFGRVSGWTLLTGVLDVVLGAMFFIHPLVGGLAVSWLAGVVVIVTGAMDVAASWRTRAYTGTGMAALGVVGGVLSMAFGVLMLAMPELFIVYLGCMAIMRGVMVIIAAFGVARLVKDFKRVLGA